MADWLITLFCSATRYKKQGNQREEPSKSAVGTWSQSDLFPIYGVTLGKTTIRELEKLGSKDKSFDLYKIQGFNFWYEKNVATRMYLVRDDRRLPEKWTAMGFDWGLSYNQVTELLKRLGYSVNVIQPPMIKQYRGYDSLYADIEAIKPEGSPIKLQFGFRYGKATRTDSPETLYNMRVEYLRKD